MAVKVREKNGKWWLCATVIALAGCGSPRQRPEPAALEARAELPPHVVEVAQGLYSCERGYLIKQGRCIPFEELPPGPAMEVSSLPSAGDGAPGTCPSGGCGAWYSSTPSYSFVYAGANYYGAGWPGFYDGRICVPRVHRFRGGEFAFGSSFGSFVQERRFAAAEFMDARLRVQSSAVRRSQAGGRFRGNHAGRWR
jgi:hypothetical protein